MSGRDLSAELFGDVPTSGARDLTAELFGASASPAKPISRLEKIGHGMMDPINGGAQLLTNALPDGVVQAGNRLNNWLADKTGLVARLPEGGVDQMTREAEQEYAARRASAGESGIDGYRLLGNVASPANLALASRIPGTGASLLRRIAGGAAAGGVSGGLMPVAYGDFWSEKAKQAGTGAAIGGAIPAVGSGIARVISPNASRNPNLALLKREGVQPTIGQALGGMANKVEERMQSLPIFGDMITKARGGVNTQFETAAFNRALKPIGESLPDGLAGREAIAYTETVLKQRYNDVLDSIGAITPDQSFTNKVADLTKMVKGHVMPKAEKQKFMSALDDVRASLDKNGVMTSDAFKTLESSLGADAKRLGASQNIYESKLAPAVTQLREELNAMLRRQAGRQADDLKAVNAGWANFKRVQNAASKLGADDGSFTPAQFQNAVRALDKSKDKGAFARGKALGQDLGDAGKSMLGSKVPNSGTPERMWLNIGAISTGAINPAIPLSLLGGAALYTPTAQRLLGAAVSSRPALAKPIADGFRKTAPVLVPASAQLGLNLLDH